MKIKSQSQIIATVLLILLVITITFILIAFIVPFVQKQLKGTNCVDVIGEIGFRDNPKYTCFEAGTTQTSNEVRLQVHIGDIIEKISGFRIVLSSEGISKAYEIKEGNTAVDNVMMFEEQDNDPLELPGNNEERTYVIQVEKYPENVKIFPILADGKVCKESDSINNLPDNCAEI